MDAEAYHFLSTCLQPRPLPPSDHPAARLVPQLVRMGFLCPAEVGPERARPVPEAQWSGTGFVLSAPETVHLAITARCNLACPGCYVPRPAAGPELTVTELRGLIDQWARPQAGAQKLVHLRVHLQRDAALALEGHPAKGLRPQCHRFRQSPGGSQRQ